MTSYDLIELAARNLKQSVLRNSLTTIGISVGVASLVSMLSLGIGLQRLATSRISKFGYNSITVTNPALGGRGGPLQGAQAPPQNHPLDDAAVAEIARIPRVAEVWPDMRLSAAVKFDGSERRTQFTGLTESASANGFIAAFHGAKFTSQQAAEAIVESRFAAELLGRTPAPAARGPVAPEPFNGAPYAADLIGRDIEFTYLARPANEAAFAGEEHTQKVRIVGIADLDAEVGPGLVRAGVYLPQKFAESLRPMAPNFGGDRNAGIYLTLSVRTKDPSDVLQVETAIKKAGYNAVSLLDAQKTMQIAFAVIDVFLGAFGSLALAVASIGIVNTLVMAILQRQREIGIMKAIGASDSDVRRIFFAEAAAMGVLGGFAGVILGWLIGRVINAGANLYFRNQGLPNQDLWYVPWWLAAGAILFAISVSLGAGAYPAARASKLDPVEALRYQ